MWQGILTKQLSLIERKYLGKILFRGFESRLEKPVMCSSDISKQGFQKKLFPKNRFLGPFLLSKQMVQFYEYRIHTREYWRAAQ